MEDMPRIGRRSGSAVVFAVVLLGVGLTVLLWRPVSSDAPQVSADPSPVGADTPPVSSAPDAEAWATYQHAKTDITIEYPAHWSVGARPEGSIAGHLAAADRPVHLYVTAFIGASSLEDFARSKFEAQPDIFRAAGPAKTMEGPGWRGLLQEADDIREGRPEETRRVVLCAVHDDLYVALALYLNPAELTPKRQYYERLFTSLRFTGKEAPRTPAVHQH
jgi:hypothetical protein